MDSSHIPQLFLVIGLIIAGAQVAGAAARAIGQPRVFGELLIGIVLGPTLLNMLHWDFLSDPELLAVTIEQLAELGVLFLMFTVGLEVHLRELLQVGRVAIWGGTLGAVLPVLLSVPAVLLFDFSREEAIFAGVVLAATSVSISAQTLLELGLLRTKEGIGLLAAAVVDDILAILLLSVVIATLGTDAGASAGDLVWIFVRMMLYLGGALAIAWYVLPPLFNRIFRSRRLTASTASFALIAALIFGWSADVLGGMAAITGAFIAGVGLSQTSERPHALISETVNHISYAFLVPIFFVNVGLHVDLTQVSRDLVPLAMLLVVIAVVSKIVGSGSGALLGGFTRGESFRLGVCMISRGEVGLIIASLGLSAGLLSEDLFETTFLVILLTTVMTPPLVRWVFKGHEPEALKTPQRQKAKG
ncbi:MAG: cation:proton antiporter [Anaerolineae bacterium]|nr:cation:proton antiporter [Anaerolineae bacterium]